MVSKKPWKTSNQIIETIKRRIFFPTSEVTFDDNDLLEFCNDELLGSQVPSVLQYHEEYFVYTLREPLRANILRYDIPDRAIGMRLRAVYFEDTNGNLYEMSRILPSDIAFYQSSTNLTDNPYRYIVENNEIVVVSGSPTNNSGYLTMKFYLRPNQLVLNKQAFVVESFQKAITLTTNLTVGNKLTIGDLTFLAVAGVPSTAFEFQVGVTSIVTASNLANTITNQEDYSATNETPATNIVTVTYTDINTKFYSIATALKWSDDITFYSSTAVPEAFTNDDVYDFLQTSGGHKTYLYDMDIARSGVSTNTLTFPEDNTPDGFIVGDYICIANECIIPQIPSDLHNLLVERTCERVLSALGDFDAANKSGQKIAEMEQRQGTMIDNRVEGNPLKVFNKTSLLRFGKSSRRGLV